jgi:hypothetical protein
MEALYTVMPPCTAKSTLNLKALAEIMKLQTALIDEVQCNPVTKWGPYLEIQKELQQIALEIIITKFSSAQSILHPASIRVNRSHWRFGLTSPPYYYYIIITITSQTYTYYVIFSKL